MKYHFLDCKSNSKRLENGVYIGPMGKIYPHDNPQVKPGNEGSIWSNIVKVTGIITISLGTTISRTALVA